MKKRKLLSLLLAGAMVVGLLAGCGGGTQGTEETGGQSPAPGTESPTGGEEPTGEFVININIASEPQTIDPALNTAVDGAVMLQHMFEGLMRWNDSGVETPGSDGQLHNAAIGPGQAESYESVINDDGTATYTFHLRDGITWSDGQPVTANDFVFAWQRLVDPETAADYSYMIGDVVNANAIINGEMDPSELGVSAPDDKTFVVTLNNDIPYFLEICAFPACFPVREDVVGNAEWTYSPDTYISNGPYVMSERVTNSHISMVPNEHYWDFESLGPDTITFHMMDDANAMISGYRSGDLDYIENMPVDEIPTLLASGELKIVDYLSTYYVCFQNQLEPFDDPLVREAFTLAIDRTYLVQNISQTGEVEAGAYVPNGVYGAEGATGPIFREEEGGGDYYDPSAEAYEANCERARQLLAEAGYPNGEGFPVVEYLYNTDDRHQAIAEALQNMWETELGVDVTLRNEEWNSFLETRKQGDYSIARNGWTADYNDPMSFLDMFLTGGGNNDAKFENEQFDALIAAAKAETDHGARWATLHQAEDILMGEWAVAPLFYYTHKFMMNDDIQGAYYSPLGYTMFDRCTQG